MGTTETQQIEDYGNNRDTANRGLWEPQEHSKYRIMGTTEAQQIEDCENHSDTAGIWLWELQLHIGKRIIRTTGIQQMGTAEKHGAEDYDNHMETEVRGLW